MTLEHIEDEVLVNQSAENKWLMGILGSLIVAAILGLVGNTIAHQNLAGHPVMEERQARFQLQVDREHEVFRRDLDQIKNSQMEILEELRRQ